LAPKCSAANHLKQGFITQQVTRWLNIAGAVALPIMLWNTAAIWSESGRLARTALLATWLVMMLVQVELFVLHPMMDRLLDIRPRAVLDDERFDFLHQAYLTSSSVQWATGLLHIWCVVGSRPSCRQDEV
jgi:hypothetical protein